MNLETEGMHIVCDDGVTRTITVHLVIASGDCPGIASVIHHGGHQSKFGCRICLIASERCESSVKKMTEVTRKLVLVDTILDPLILMTRDK